MGFTFACPSCREDIHANEGMEGLHGRCPHCAVTFTIPEQAGAFRREAPARAERDDRDLEPRSRYGDDDHEVSGPRLGPGWPTVRNGLLLVRIGAIIGIFVTLAMILIVALGSGLIPLLDRNRNADMIIGTLAIGASLVFLGAAILDLVGQFMCCAVPESGPKGLAIGSVICVILALLLFAGVILLSVIQGQRRQFGRPPNLAPLIAAFNILGLVLGMVGHALFGFYLKGIANFFENRQLSKSAGIYLILLGVFVASSLVGLVMLILVEVARGPRDLETIRILFLVMSVGLLVFGLVLALWFLDLLGRARSIIARELQQG